MAHLRWERRHDLRRPVLVAAFEGWNDAGDAASLALSYLASAWKAKRLAAIDCEEFFDFTVTRPLVRNLSDPRAKRRRRVEWPDFELLGARLPFGDHDVLFLRGTEPQLRWRTFCETCVQAAKEVEASMVVTLGALLADVAHTKPTRVTGTSDDPALAERLQLRPSRYEGPTGIIGVLHEAFDRAGIPSASFWAAVPHYVQQLACPQAAMALVARTADLIGAEVDLAELEQLSDDYVRQVDERVQADEEASLYVAGLEQAQDDEDLPEDDDPEGLLGQLSAEQLADEAARFLKNHRPGQG